MTGIDLYSTQQAIFNYIVTQIPWEVVDSQVPDAESLAATNGIADPYVSVRFSQMLPTSGGTSFNGPLYDEYYSYVDFLCIAPTAQEARELASFVDRNILGHAFPNTGALKPQFGGGQFAISLDTQHPLAFVAITAYRYSLNLSDVGAGYVGT